MDFQKGKENENYVSASFFFWKNGNFIIKCAKKLPYTFTIDIIF